MKKFAHPRIASLSLLLMSAAGCVQGMQINEYPIRDPDASDGDPASRSKYWSAYVRLESANIPKSWDTSSLDYILITAKAKIPTRNGPLVRDFPLFTIKDKQVQSQSGVDLLKKIPLSEKARDQVAITIEVRFIRKKKAMDVVQKILKEVTKVAEPYLNSYPIASQIIGSAVPLIDELVPNEKTAPSSATTLIVPEELSGKRKLIAFTLMPLSEESSVQDSLDGAKIYECANMRGALCVADPAAASPGPAAGAAKQPVDPANGGDTGLSAGTLDELRRLKQILLDSHRPPRDGTDKYTINASAWTRFKDLIGRAVPEIVHLDPTQLQAYELANNLETLIAVYDKNLYRVAAEDRLARFSYQGHRLKDVVYLTVSFRGYDGVFDPMILLRDALSDCGQVTSTSIQQARDYLSANEDLFAPEDVDLAKRTFRLARLLLALREFSAKRSYDEILALFEEAQPRVGPTFYIQESPSKGPDDLQRHYGALSKCLASAAGTSPASTMRKIWQLSRSEPALELRVRAPQAPGVVDADVFRLDLVGHALGELAAITGKEYDIAAADPFPTLSSPLVKALHQEAVRLYQSQPKQEPPRDACDTPAGLEQLARRVSLTCVKCWEDLKRVCAAKVPNAHSTLAAHQSTRKQAVIVHFDEPLAFSQD